MSIKLSQAVKVNGALIELIKKDTENKLLFSALIRCRLRDNIKALKPIMDEYQNTNDALVSEYGTLIVDKETGLPNANGLKEVKQDSENWEKFKVPFEAMLSKEFDVKIKPLTEAELFGAETKDFRVDVGTLIALESLGLLEAGAKTVPASKRLR